MNDKIIESKGSISRSIKRNKVQKVAYQIVKINENKVTFILFKLRAFEDMEGNDRVVISTESQIGDSITLKASKECIDKIIMNYGDIVSKLVHNEGIVTDVITFDEQ